MYRCMWIGICVSSHIKQIQLSKPPGLSEMALYKHRAGNWVFLSGPSVFDGESVAAAFLHEELCPLFPLVIFRLSFLITLPTEVSSLKASDHKTDAHVLTHHLPALAGAESPDTGAGGCSGGGRLVCKGWWYLPEPGLPSAARGRSLLMSFCSFSAALIAFPARFLGRLIIVLGR